MAKRGLEDCRLREQRMNAEREKELARLDQKKEEGRGRVEIYA